LSEFFARQRDGRLPVPIQYYTTNLSPCQGLFYFFFTFFDFLLFGAQPLPKRKSKSQTKFQKWKNICKKPLDKPLKVRYNSANEEILTDCSRKETKPWQHRKK
jgi:hypothetical protein